MDPERLILEFQNLLFIESPSKKEGKLAYYIADIFEALGFKCFFDNSAENTGSEVGNLIVKIPGTIPSEPLFFCAHLDTVGPCENPNIIYENGIFRTDGKTILGADDKAGIAILIETAKVLKENFFPYPPLEFIFTTCEEIGLLGAKYLNIELLDAKEGLVLDSKSPQVIINGAPSSFKFFLEINGKSAHAGIEPEKGINAIHLLAKILAELPTGRIDEETTMNIGKISGGKYINIVPDLAIAEGEMRSHSQEKLEKLQQLIQHKVEEIIKKYPVKIDDLPSFKLKFKKIFQAFYIPPSDNLCQLVQKAGQRLGWEMTFKKHEGGSDANVFNEKGLKSLILGTGMQRVHTTQEFIEVKDLIKATQLVIEIIKLKSELS